MLGRWSTPSGNVAEAYFRDGGVKVEWERGLPRSAGEQQFYYRTIQPQLIAAIRRHLELLGTTLVVNL
jgi:hypothetical protein